MYWPADYFTTIYNNLNFEDAKDFLMQNTDVFACYMLGTWSTSTEYGTQTITMGDDHVVSGMIETPGGGYYAINNGVWQYQYDNTDEWIDYFKITITSKNSFTLYSYQSGKTYRLNKK